MDMCSPNFNTYHKFKQTQTLDVLIFLKQIDIQSEIHPFCRNIVSVRQSVWALKEIIIRLVNETRTIALVQAGMQANHFARTIDCTGNITNFTENRAGKSFFISEDSKETCH